MSSVWETLYNCHRFHFIALAYSVLQVDVRCDLFIHSVASELLDGIQFWISTDKTPKSIPAHILGCAAHTVFNRWRWSC